MRGTTPSHPASRSDHCTVPGIRPPGRHSTSVARLSGRAAPRAASCRAVGRDWTGRAAPHRDTADAGRSVSRNDHASGRGDTATPTRHTARPHTDVSHETRHVHVPGTSMHSSPRPSHAALARRLARGATRGRPRIWLMSMHMYHRHNKNMAPQPSPHASQSPSPHAAALCLTHAPAPQ